MAEVIAFILLCVLDFFVGYVFITLFEKINIWYAREALNQSVKKYTRSFKLKMALLWVAVGIVWEVLRRIFG